MCAIVLAMKRDFIEHVVEAVPYRDERRASVAESLKYVFKTLDIPEPKAGEFRHGLGHFGQVFINTSGMVMRVVHNEKTPLYRHRHLMRPIGSVMLADIVRLDFQYGGETNISREEISSVEKSLADNDLLVGDLRPANTCRLKIGTVDFPKGIPIVFDASSIHRYRHIVRNISEQQLHAQQSLRVIDMRPVEDEIPDEQDIAFDNLRQNFARAIAANDNDGNMSKEFWNATKSVKHQGLTTPSWSKKWFMDHVWSVHRSSRNYAKSLTAHNPELF